MKKTINIDSRAHKEIGKFPLKVQKGIASLIGEFCMHMLGKIQL